MSERGPRRGLRHLRLALLAAALPAASALIGTPAGAADDAAQLAAGKALFTGGAMPPCGLCHTLKDAGANGAVGPVLDELQPDAARVATALRTGIGAMPSYKAALKEEQIQALARYVSKASGGAQ